MTNMTKKSPVSAYGYVRVSTEEQEENEISIESQIRAVKLYAAEHGFELAEMFVACLSAFHPHPLDVDLKAYPLCSHGVGV